ncbi:hypothetical protein AMTRI_Chr02g256530 [Amborella trichopoda]
MTCILEPIADEGEIRAAGDGELLYIRDEYISTFAAAGLKFVTIKVEKESPQVLRDSQLPPTHHLPRCMTFLQVNTFCFVSYSLL